MIGDNFLPSISDFKKRMILSNWRFVNPELIGLKVNNLEELIEKFPESKNHSNAYLREQCNGVEGFHSILKGYNPYESLKGFNIYSRKDKNKISNIAYGCHECNKIIIGPPKITISEDLIGNVGPAEYYCVNCNALLRHEEYEKEIFID